MATKNPECGSFVRYSNSKRHVERDGTFFLKSDKGKKSITFRKPRKRAATKRGISKEHIFILVAQDRNGQVISQMAGMGKTKISSVPFSLVFAITDLLNQYFFEYGTFLLVWI